MSLPPPSPLRAHRRDSDSDSHSDPEKSVRSASWAFFRPETEKRNGKRKASPVEPMAEGDGDVVPETLPLEDGDPPGGVDLQLPSISTKTTRRSVPLSARKTTTAGPPLRKRPRRTNGDPPTSTSTNPPPIFENLCFHFIPNNDIAPARRARINKVLEHGGQWEREVGKAMYIVVDRGLKWGDVERFVEGRGEGVVVVNERFTVDCVRFRKLLNAGQGRYEVEGFVGEERKKEKEGKEEMEKKEKDGDDEEVIVIPSSIPSPASSSSSSSSSSPPAPVHIVSDRSDPLSSYIRMIQQYKHLPLDEDPHADSASVSDSDSVISRSTPPPTTPSAPSAPKSVFPFEKRFACSHGGLAPTNQPPTNPNAPTITILRQMCTFYENTADEWRTMAYRKAITTLSRTPQAITTAAQARKLPNVGNRLAEKIQEIASTRALRRLEAAREDPRARTLGLFLGVYGVGSLTAQRWVARGFRSLEDLVENAELTEGQRVGIERYEDLGRRIPREEVAEIGEIVRGVVEEVRPGVEAIVAGSFRRGGESSGDVDVIMFSRGPQDEGLLPGVVQKLADMGVLTVTLSGGVEREQSGKWMGCCILPEDSARKLAGDPEEFVYKPVWRRLDLLVVPRAERGAALLYFTGNDVFNRSMRLLASKKGMRLNQHGLWRHVMRRPGRTKATKGELLEAEDERRIFELLGVTWREPHQRWC